MPRSGSQNEQQQHLFIVHGEDSRRNFSRSVGHARRTQAVRRHHQQRESAKHAAGYARGLVGWRTADPAHGSRGPSRELVFRVRGDVPKSGLAPGTEQPAGQSREEGSIQSAVDNGLRADPFNSFPSDNSRAAMHAVDFYINIWSMYKRGAIDVFLGLNTQIDLCWPIALQDDMLFDATLTVSRVAYCVSSSRPAEDDAFFLKHKQLALAKLRQRVVEHAPGGEPTEAVVFTVSRLLSISYMTLDDASFQMHFNALQNITRSYMRHRTADDQMTRVVASRIKSWTPLFEYRQSKTGFGQGSLQPAQHMPPVTRLPAVLPDDIRRKVLALPSGFAHLAVGGAFSTQTVNLMAGMQDILAKLEAADGKDTGDVTEHHLWVIKQELIDLLASLELDAFEQQVCQGLLALAIALPRIYRIGPSDVCSLSKGVPSIVENPPLERIVKAFLYLKFSGKLQSSLHNLCLQWCALAVGCCCFLVPDSAGSIQTKGHIALLSITERLVPESKNDPWAPFDKDLRAPFFWPDKIVRIWKYIYLESVKRQAKWEKNGLMKMGMPSRDKVEYMVLR
jgi:hypothetical protein